MAASMVVCWASYLAAAMAVRMVELSAVNLAVATVPGLAVRKVVQTAACWVAATVGY